MPANKVVTALKVVIDAYAQYERCRAIDDQLHAECYPHEYASSAAALDEAKTKLAEALYDAMLEEVSQSCRLSTRVE